MATTHHRVSDGGVAQNARLLPLATSEGATAFQPAASDRLLRWFGHRRWLRYGLRNRLLCALRNPATMERQPFETAFAGFRYRGDLSRWIDWIVYYFGVYEVDELELVRRRLSDDQAIALDIGANVGHHTLYLASFCAHVHAFEPFEGVARFIDEKVALNKLEHHITVHRVGLSDADAELPYFASTGNNIGNGTFVPSLADAHEAPSCVLALRHGDRCVASLNLPRVDLVKIDVEGFELKVLEGLRQTLARYRPLVMLELSDTVRAELGSMQQLLALLPQGYDVQRIMPPIARRTLFSSGHATLAPLGPQWARHSNPGGYVNLLLCPT
jgi:FkbM family methyltransferase